MKKCPKCGEVYTDEVDTCPPCNIDIDTGEDIGIGKDIDLTQLKIAYELYKKSIFYLRAIVVIFASIIGVLILFERFFPKLLNVLAGGAFFLLFLLFVVSYVHVLTKTYQLAKSLDEASSELIFVFLNPFFAGWKYSKEAKRIIERAESVS